MLHAAVDDGDDAAAEVERDVPVLERAAVQEQRVAGPGHEADELVHDAALHPDEVVLGTLAEERQAGALHLEPDELLDDQGRDDLQRGRGAEARTLGEVAAEGEIHGAELDSRGREHAEDAADVVAPGPTRVALDRGVEGEGRALREVGGADADLAPLAQPSGELDAGVDGHREHEAVVVVGVLADQVDAPRGPPGDDRAARAERPVEDLPHRRPPLVPPGPVPRALVTRRAHDPTPPPRWRSRGPPAAARPRSPRPRCR